MRTKEKKALLVKLFGTEVLFNESNFDSVLATLSPREEMVLRLRYGFEDGICRTQKETGIYFDIGGSAIGVIEKKAFRKLRHPIRVKHFFK